MNTDLFFSDLMDRLQLFEGMRIEEEEFIDVFPEVRRNMRGEYVSGATNLGDWYWIGLRVIYQLTAYVRGDQRFLIVEKIVFFNEDCETSIA